MTILPIVLILLAVVFLVLGILRVCSIVNYNKRLRLQRARSRTKMRRRARPKQIDTMTIFLFLTALVLLLAAMLFLKGSSDRPVKKPDETQPSIEVTQGTEPPAAIGWKKDGDKKYYLTEDGAKVTGWLDVDGKRYYFQADGSAALGWLTVDGVEYYFRADNSMARGEVQIDGKTYFFSAAGKQVVMVNPWHAVPEDYESDLVALSTDYGVEGSQVDCSCINDLISMLDACNAEAPRAYVVSAYRSYDHQVRNYQRKINYYLEQGYSQADAEKEAATEVAVPGTSEHQLGLAVDIIDTRSWDLTAEQANLPAQQWLLENSWRYGFLFRYPDNKIDVTGIIYEPWHYRYVGKELAKEIHNSGLTMEEYLAALS